MSAVDQGGPRDPPVAALVVDRLQIGLHGMLDEAHEEDGREHRLGKGLLRRGFIAGIEVEYVADCRAEGLPMPIGWRRALPGRSLRRLGSRLGTWPAHSDPLLPPELRAMSSVR